MIEIAEDELMDPCNQKQMLKKTGKTILTKRISLIKQLENVKNTNKDAKRLGIA